MMFDNRYEVVLADTANSKAINYHLRYRVFCLEKGFENAGRFKNQMEKDRYDDHAVHFLVRDKKRNRWIAAARLVVGPADYLPINRVAEIDLPDVGSEMVIAEFSRLLILDEYRNAGGNGNHNRVSEPEVLLGLIRAAKEYCLSINIEQWVFLCRRSICRILDGLGIAMEQIGPACTFRGVRVPYRMNLQSAFDAVPDASPITQRMLARTHQSFYRYSDAGYFDNLRTLAA
ncbi:PEP-CTERM/exosortase system-associated acyltransferase [Methylomagnum sp.]